MGTVSFSYLKKGSSVRLGFGPLSTTKLLEPIKFLKFKADYCIVYNDLSTCGFLGFAKDFSFKRYCTKLLRLASSDP
jgi:hypothetical protein